jgi:putative transposase
MLYHRFCMSFRDVEDLLAERGIIVSFEAIRQWCRKFGAGDGQRLKRKQGRLGDIWYLDELFVRINGQQQYLWRAIDQDGDVIDILLQPRRDQGAARAIPSQVGARSTPGAVPDRHRQTQELRCSKANNSVGGSPRHPTICQQPRRGFAPTHSGERTTNASVQIPTTSSAFFVDPQYRAKPISRWATFDEIHESSIPSISVFRGLANGNGSLTFCSSPRPSPRLASNSR